MSMVRTALILIFIGLALQPAFSQRKGKKRSAAQEQEAFSPYAYETEATTKRKTKGRSMSGDNDRYSIERPAAPTEIGQNDRTYDYSKGPYFGHLRPVIKRPPGKQKLCRECGIWH